MFVFKHQALKNHPAMQEYNKFSGRFILFR